MAVEQPELKASVATAWPVGSSEDAVGSFEDEASLLSPSMSVCFAFMATQLDILAD